MCTMKHEKVNHSYPIWSFTPGPLARAAALSGVSTFLKAAAEDPADPAAPAAPSTPRPQDPAAVAPLDLASASEFRGRQGRNQGSLKIHGMFNMNVQN